MRKTITIIMLLMTVMTYGQTTYLPAYECYLHIVNGADTLAVYNHLDTLELADPGGLFTLRLDHEDMTKERVKAIKRAKRKAGWASFRAALHGVSTSFSDNSLQYRIRSQDAVLAATLAEFYNAKAKEEQTLAINLSIDNNSDYELMVCDMERGTTWWILPRQSMDLELNNPEATTLRISDAKSNYVRYATVLAGSITKKWEIALETDEYWYSPVYMKDKPHETSTILHYIRINKKDYKEEKLKKEEFWEIKKSAKKTKK